MSDEILVADDHELVRDVVAAYLEREGGFVVSTVPDQPAACVKIREHGPFGLVMADWRMPGMDGLAGLAELVALNGRGTVALITDTIDRRDAEAVLAAGAAGYVPKTLPARSLVHAVRLMLAGEVYAPSCRDPAGAAGPLPTLLSPRERQVLVMLCRGLANKEIGRELGVAEVTVKLHVRTLCRKLGAKNRTHAAMIARDTRIA